MSFPWSFPSKPPFSSEIFHNFEIRLTRGYPDFERSIRSFTHQYPHPCRPTQVGWWERNSQVPTLESSGRDRVFPEPLQNNTVYLKPSEKHVSNPDIIWASLTRRSRNILDASSWAVAATVWETGCKRPGGSWQDIEFIRISKQI